MIANGRRAAGGGAYQDLKRGPSVLGCGDGTRHLLKNSRSYAWLQARKGYCEAMAPVPSHLSRYSLTISPGLADECFTWWKWLAAAGLRPMLVTKFGDWILEGSESKLHFLDLLEGIVAPLEAHSQDLQNPAFSSNFKDQLSVDWVEVCLNSGMTLGPEQCYGWKVHPMIGGGLSSSNIQSFSFRVHQSLNSQLHQQLLGRQGVGKVTGFSVAEE